MWGLSAAPRFGADGDNDHAVIDAASTKLALDEVVPDGLGLVSDVGAGMEEVLSFSSTP